jgi:exopolyphosphatase/guanosine-5'-triphosphate,3'-diphosphate pyrophosphatase
MDGSSEIKPAPTPASVTHTQAAAPRVPQDRRASNRPVPDRRASDRPAYAALDLGTNNCRLLIAEPTRSGFRVVDSFSRIVRLGAGLTHHGALSVEAMDKAVEGLRICRTKMDARNVVRRRLIATEACRQAANGEAFIERVEKETGLTLEIADRRTEARLPCPAAPHWSSAKPMA